MLTAPAGVTLLTVSLPYVGDVEVAGGVEGQASGIVEPGGEGGDGRRNRERDRDAERAGALVDGLAAGAEIHRRQQQADFHKLLTTHSDGMRVSACGDPTSGFGGDGSAARRTRMRESLVTPLWTKLAV